MADLDTFDNYPAREKNEKNFAFSNEATNLESLKWFRFEGGRNMPNIVSVDTFKETQRGWMSWKKVRGTKEPGFRRCASGHSQVKWAIKQAIPSFYWREGNVCVTQSITICGTEVGIARVAFETYPMTYLLLRIEHVKATGRKGFDPRSPAFLFEAKTTRPPNRLISMLMH